MQELKKLARRALEILAEAGAEMAQCTLSRSEKREFNVDGGSFSLFRTTFNHRLTLIGFLGGKRGTVSVNRLDEETIARAAKECMALAEAGVDDPAWQIAEHIGERDFVSGAPTPDTDALFSRTVELKETIEVRHPSILMEQMIVDHTRVESVYADSNGNLYSELSGAYAASLMFSAHEGERASSFFGVGFAADTLDKPFMEYGAVAKSLSDVEQQIITTPVSEKFVGTVIFTPDCLAAMLSSVIGNFASGTPLIDGTSIWRDKVGQSVAKESFTLSLEPKNDAVVLREEYTGDGYLSENFDLIRGGVLTGFVASAYVANKAGCTRSPNTSSAYVMPAGDKTLEEMISGIENGLLVSRFSGGEPAGNGDFSGVAKNSFLIRDGKLAGAVSETMISGNLAEMLMNFEGASAERIADGSTLLPYAAFSGITVSGK